MPKLKAHAKLLAAALISLAILGCSATPDYIEIRPSCIVPPMPLSLPHIDVDALYDAAGWDLAEALRDRERLIVDSLLEHRAALTELCQDDA